MSVTTFFRVVMAVGRGCPSTAWCLSLAAGHALVLGAHWSAEAQAEIFGNGHFVAPHRAADKGVLTREGDTYRVTGTWDYASGVPYATHLIGGARIADAEGSLSREVYAVVVPIENCTILSDWGNSRMLGLNGSGSFSVRVENAVVPMSWAVPFDWNNRDMTDGTQGTRLHGNPMYLGRNLSFYAGELISAITGLGRATVDAAEKVLRTKDTLLGPPMPRMENPDFLRHFGHSLGEVQCAEELVMRAGDRYAELCNRWATDGTEFTETDDLANNSLLLHASSLIDSSTRRLFSTAGTSEARQGARLQRYIRDLMMQRTHLAGWGTLANMGQIRGRAEVTGQGITPD